MIELYTAGTPNGKKVSIALEEMSLEYRVIPIKLSELEQKEDWYLAWGHSRSRARAGR